MKATMKNWNGWVKETDPITLDKTYKQLLLDAGFKIVGECDHHFQPQGYTKLYLLAESHFAIHTFPEEGKTYLELSSCVERQYHRFLASLSAKTIERA